MKSRSKIWPVIRQRGDSFVVDCGKVFGPSRLRKSFPTIEAATEYAADRRKDRSEIQAIAAHEARNRAVSLANLTDGQRYETIESWKRLNRPTGLVAAVDFYLQHNERSGTGMSLKDLYDHYIASKQTANKRARTIKNIKSHLGYFVADYGAEPAKSITTGRILWWINDRGYVGSTRNVYRTAFLGLFNHGLKVGAVDKNPVAGIEKAATDEKDVQILSVSDVRAIMAKVSELYPVLVPYFAVGLFAGLRPENELTGLDWSMIDFKRKKIKVVSATSKKRRTRYVDMPNNLIKWLMEHREKSGPVFFSRFKMRNTVKKAGVKWSRDVMRHTYASHLLAKSDNAPLTARQLGHGGDTSVLFEHYAALVTRKDGKAYFAIQPDQKPVIKMVKTA